MPGAVVAWRGPVMLGRGDIGGLRNILLNTKSPSSAPHVLHHPRDDLPLFIGVPLRSAKRDEQYITKRASSGVPKHRLR
jgi:hypothetical protein